MLVFFRWSAWLRILRLVPEVILRHSWVLSLARRRSSQNLRGGRVGVVRGNRRTCHFALAMGLIKHTDNVSGLTWRRDEIESTIVQRLQIFIPVCKTRSNNQANVPAPRTRHGQEVAISAVRQTTFAKHDMNLVVVEHFFALAGRSGINRFPAFSV